MHYIELFLPIIEKTRLFLWYGSQKDTYEASYKSREAMNWETDVCLWSVQAVWQHWLQVYTTENSDHSQHQPHPQTRPWGQLGGSYCSRGDSSHQQGAL